MYTRLFLFVWILLLSASSLQAQKTFVRIFNDKDVKIHKGYIHALSDSSMTILKGKDTIEVPVSSIAYIRLHHSFGSAVFKGALITGLASAAIFAAASDPKSWVINDPGTGALLGLVFGSTWGAILGAAIGAPQKRPVYRVNKNQADWLPVKNSLARYLRHDNKG